MKPTKSQSLVGLKTALVLLAINSSAAASTDEALIKFVNQYDNCVMTVSLGITGELHAVAEQSFYACRTEEAAVRARLSFALDPSTVEAIIVRHKLWLKQKILADPPH